MPIKSDVKYNFKNLKPHWRHKRIFRKWFLGAMGKRTLENTIESLARRGIIAKAGLQAIKDQHDKGLAVTLKIGNSIYRVYPNGKKEEIGYIVPTMVDIKKDFLQIPD